MFHTKQWELLEVGTLFINAPTPNKQLEYPIYPLKLMRSNMRYSYPVYQETPTADGYKAGLCITNTGDWTVGGVGNTYGNVEITWSPGGIHIAVSLDDSVFRKHLSSNVLV